MLGTLPACDLNNLASIIGRYYSESIVWTQQITAEDSIFAHGGCTVHVLGGSIGDYPGALSRPLHGQSPPL